jgi:hypothetical protein
MSLSYFFQFIHILNELFISFYIFIFYWTKKYDIYFCIYHLIIIIHWLLLKNECILSYLEKKTRDKNYKLGDNPFEHPFYNLLPKYSLNILVFFKLLNILVIFYRNLDNKYIISLICIIVIYHIFRKVFIH